MEEMQQKNSNSLNTGSQNALPSNQACWNIEGILGDSSCPQLKTVIHCHNCSVYAEVGRRIFEREAPPGYLETWTSRVTQVGREEFPQSQEYLLSILIFRIGLEWLAFPSNIFQEVTRPSLVHTIPHRSDDIFQGIVNIRGSLLLCVSLSKLLGIRELKPEPHHSQIDYFRAQWRKQEESQSSSLNSKTSSPSLMTPSSYMIVVVKQGARWVFPVDEIAGIHRYPIEYFQATPAVISQTSDSYTVGIVTWQGNQVSYLDDARLFVTLNEKVL